MQHGKNYLNSWFVTLTYNEENLPRTKNGFATVNKKDVQNFFKKLRRNHPKSGEKISYFAAAEYGTKHKRPHYHIILFGCTDPEITSAWTTDTRGGKRPQPLGEIYFGYVEGASIGYTLKYISKEPDWQLHDRDDRLRTFFLISKGIGANYLTPQMIRYHHRDLENRVCCTVEKKSISMPRYYKMKIYTPELKGYLKGYFEYLAPFIDEELRQKHKHLTNYEYETMLSERHKHLTNKYQQNAKRKNE